MTPGVDTAVFGKYKRGVLASCDTDCFLVAEFFLGNANRLGGRLLESLEVSPGEDSAIGGEGKRMCAATVKRSDRWVAFKLEFAGSLRVE